MAQKAPKRLKRGRLRRDYSDDPDLEVVEWAIALQAAWDMSERRAIDLALAICQGESVPPSKMPRGGAGKPWRLVGRKLPMERRFASRNADIRRKLKIRKLHPNREMVLTIARLLHRLRRL
jgi:hypothetical protein